MHNVFHVSLLKPYVLPDGVGRARMVPQPLEWLDGEPLFTVDKLVDWHMVSIGRRKVVEFKVRWLHFTDTFDTWEPRSNLMEHADDLVLAYEAAQAAAGVSVPVCHKSGTVKLPKPVKATALQPAVPAPPVPVPPVVPAPVLDPSVRRGTRKRVAKTFHE